MNMGCVAGDWARSIMSVEINLISLHTSNLLLRATIPTHKLFTIPHIPNNKQIHRGYIVNNKEKFCYLEKLKNVPVCTRLYLIVNSTSNLVLLITMD